MNNGSNDAGGALMSLAGELRKHLHALREQRVRLYIPSTGISLCHAADAAAPGEEPVAAYAAENEFTVDDVRNELGECRRCPLHGTRKNIVFGEGDARASLVFVGEAPGEQEDIQGRPFVGRAGQLLTDIIKAMHLNRNQVYICNILKCRPPANRNPNPEEISVCEPFLIRQLEAIRPKMICALGTFAAKTLLKTDIPISKLRGRFHTYQGIPLMPTFHPAYLLRNPAEKKQVWNDIKMIMEHLQIPHSEE